MPSDSDHQYTTLIRYLVDTLPCVECGGAYEAQNIMVVDEDAQSWTLIALCAHCGAESVVRAVMDDGVDEPVVGAAESIMPETDVPVELPPDLAEVVAWRRFLHDFHGDLRDLLRR